MGEKWVEGGVLQWKGIRGGTREASYLGQGSFELRVQLEHDPAEDQNASFPVNYHIGVNVQDPVKGPRVVAERLDWANVVQFDSHHPDDPPKQPDDLQHLSVRLNRMGKRGPHGPSKTFVNYRPILSQIVEGTGIHRTIRSRSRWVLQQLESMRFLDLAPDAMRTPSLPGQTTLGDRGENLSSVLQAICQSKPDKQALEHWLRELTPMDAEDFEFPVDQTGRILLSLIESGGAHTSAYSASDGTLRFLAMVAAFLGPDPAGFYFFEELENGIHPNRLYLLLQLIEQRLKQERIQVVATSHSPQLLASLSKAAQRDAVLIYRLRGHPDARIHRIYDIPEAVRVLETQDLARLHAAGWLEDAVEFTEDEVAPA